MDRYGRQSCKLCLRFSFAALPAVSLISVPPNAVSQARFAVLPFSVPPNTIFPAPTTVFVPSVPPNACFSAPIAVWRPSVPPDASFPARIAVLASSVPLNACFPARIAGWASSVPPDGCFPAPPPTGCHGRRLRRAAAVGSVQWPSSRRPLPRDVPDLGTGIPAVDAANP